MELQFPPASVQDRWHFGSLPEMVASSDALVQGRVVDTRPGRSVGEGEEALQFRAVTIWVERVFRGFVAGETVLLEETGYGLEIEGFPASRTGDRGFYFLFAKEPGRNYSQSRFLIRGDRLVGPSGGDPLVNEVEGWAMEHFLQLLEVAAQAAARGEVASIRR